MKNIQHLGFAGKMFALSILLIISIPLCAMWGSADLSFAEVSKYLISKAIPGSVYEGPVYMDSIVWQLRIPRILLGIAVGGGLSTCGVSMQALTKNKLAEPYILGVSSGASSMAVLVMGIGSGTVFASLGIPAAAFIGAAVSLFLVYTLSLTNGKSSSNRLLLSGVAVSMVLNALTQFFLLMSNEGATRSALYWMMGSLGSARWTNIVLPLFVSIAGMIAMLVMSPILNILSLGDETAITMGVHVSRIRKIILVLTSLITGALVASSGCIGFVGLIIPHISRMLFGSDHRKVTIASFLIGGLFLIWMDVLARVLLAPTEISIGILTAFCGGPFFIWLMRKKKVR